MDFTTERMKRHGNAVIKRLISTIESRSRIMNPSNLIERERESREQRAEREREREREQRKKRRK